ncbi:uncharacterized protein PHA67_008067 isoform 3-T3 [Liasis olivaceus]
MSAVEVYFCSCLTGKLSVPPQFMWFFLPVLIVSSLANVSCPEPFPGFDTYCLSPLYRLIRSKPSLFFCRISYCTTDKLQNKVFAYVAQNPQSGALECHAFLSPKKKIAQAVTLTVAQAFQVALDLWQAAQAGSREEEKHLPRPMCPIESTCPPVRTPLGSPPFKTDFEDEDDEEGDLNEAFSGCREPYLWELPSHTVLLSGSLGMQSSQQLPASRDTFLNLLLLSSLFISSTTLLSAMHKEWADLSSHRPSCR